MNTQAQVVFEDPGEVEGQLSRLGLTTAILRQAVGQAALARLETTPLYPKTAAGQVQWIGGVVSLREQTIPLGDWEPSDLQNRGLLVNKKLGLVVAVAGGDEDTGMPSGSPTTRSPKGPTMKESIDRNQLRLGFDGEDFPLPIPTSIENLGTLWLLLVHVDYRKQEVRSELSRPVAYDEGRRPNAFQPRIILPAIKFDDDSMVRSGGAEPEIGGENLTVEIKRRA